MGFPFSHEVTTSLLSELCAIGYHPFGRGERARLLDGILVIRVRDITQALNDASEPPLSGVGVGHDGLVVT
jgi:hypothetical protein